MAKNIAQFAREVRQEGRKVTWPRRREVVMATIVVFIGVTIASLFLLGADWLISTAIELILGTGK